MGRWASIPRGVERDSHSSFTGFMDWADAVNANSKKDATAISRSLSRFLPLLSRFLIVGSPCLASFKTNPWDASALAKGVGYCSGNSLGLSTKWGTYFSIEPYTSADLYTIPSEQCRQFLQFGGNVCNSYRAMLRRAKCWRRALIPAASNRIEYRNSSETLVFAGRPQPAGGLDAD